MKKLAFVFCLFLIGFLATSARAQKIRGAKIEEEQTSLTLPAGQSVYLYGMTTGGAYSTLGFTLGNYQTVTDADGNISGALATASSNSDSFTTSDEYYVVGGVGVSGFSTMTQSFGANTQSGASAVSDTFSITQLSLVVFIGTASSQQSISLSGIPGLVVNAKSSEPEAMVIAHAYLPPGTYTVTEKSKATASGQDPDNMADLIGVFVFTPSCQ
jgi:hypothetical protein